MIEPGMSAPQETQPEIGGIVEHDWSAGERTVVSLISMLLQVGSDTDYLLERANITCSAKAFVDGAFRRFPAERLHALRSLAGRALSQHVAHQAGRDVIRSDDYRMLFFCLISCRTLRQAMLRAAEFARILDGRCGRMELIESGDIAEFRIDSGWPFRSGPSFVVDTLGLMTFHAIFGWLITKTIPITVLMRYPAAMLQAFNTGMLPYSIAMDSTCNAFRFEAEFLDFPVLRTGEDCETAIGADLAFLFDMKQTGTQLELAERVRRILYQALAAGQCPPSLDATADKVGMSRASFRRQLSQKGLSYRNIKDSCRREIAMDLLSRTDLNIEEIAGRLSFCDSDAFRRSFGEWIGMAPSQFRKSYDHGRT